MMTKPAKPTITRRQWAKEHNVCMAGLIFPPVNPQWSWLETHEIARGPVRQRALGVPATWLRLCNIHHDEVDNLLIWPIAKQLALKFIFDRKYYDRVAVNLLRGRDPDAVSEAEVQAYVQELERERNK
jgi:hypothetical protein